MNKYYFHKHLINVCKDFLKTVDWDIPNSYDVDGANTLQHFQKDGFKIGVLINNHDPRIWTFVMRSKNEV